MRLSLLVLAFAATPAAQAFVAPTALASPRLVGVITVDKQPAALFAVDNPTDEGDHHDEGSSPPQKNRPIASPRASTTPLALTTAAIWAATAQTSLAAGPDWGIFEGRTLSLLHPAVMAGLLVYTLYTAFLGFQWRRQRTLGDEIAALKKKLPKPAAEGEDAAPVNVEVEAQIKALQAERKDLAAAGPRDQHYAQGTLLAAVGTAFAIEGPLNTYARAGKLFPGPHLYAGAGLVVLWALAAAAVPAMQKGSDTARTVHIGANLTMIALFAWQVTSGVPILLKVIEFTKWP